MSRFKIIQNTNRLPIKTCRGCAHIHKGFDVEYVCPTIICSLKRGDCERNLIEVNEG